MQMPDVDFAPLSPKALAQDIARVAPQAEAGQGSSFNALYHQLNDEVTDFIARGSADAPSPALSVSPEGWLQQQRVQGKTALSAMEPDQASPTTQQAFLARIAPWAQASGAALGVDPHLVAAHAALESGWGQKPLRLANGQDSGNLFGIKAQAGWSGQITSALTTEYEQGAAVQRVETFRAYADDASAFRDYTRLLSNSPRYQGALHVGSDAQAFAQGLARGGYATDPHYADKLTSVAATVKARAALHSRD
ncbi:glucosaminidase domain-containing protein [Aquabacterium sp.]|uniref:glucosaminidase domain-containing protein n=1 Tax=Aquabacterium sp. TaxID=1872578 RepID=UPI0025BAB528|nr:glucosaminidase domain-containing protein [Aquabacterium sp.]